MKTQVSKTQVSKKKKKQVKAITPAGISKKIHQSTKKPSQTIHYTDVKKLPPITIPEDKQSKQRTSDSVNKAFGFYNLKTVAKEKLKQLAKNLLNWANNDKPKLFFEEFLKEYGIARSSMESHLKKSPELVEAKEYALQMISYYREHKAYDSNYWATFRFTQGIYDPQWKTQELYFNDLKKQIADKQQSSTINLLVPTIEQLQKEEDECRKKTYSK